MLITLSQTARARLAAGDMPPRREVGGVETLDDVPPVERVKGKERLYGSTSIFCLLPGHEPRKSAIRFVEHPWFDPFILCTIMANCSTMAWSSPLDPTGTQKVHRALLLLLLLRSHLLC